MKNIKNCILIILILFCSCKNKKYEKLKIIPIQSLQSRETFATKGIHTVFKTDFFLLDGWKDTRQNERMVDSFAQKNQDTLFTKLRLQPYAMVFYSSSNISIEKMALLHFSASTDKEKLEITDVNKRSYPLIFSYVWYGRTKNNPISKEKYIQKYNDSDNIQISIQHISEKDEADK